MKKAHLFFAVVFSCAGLAGLPALAKSYSIGDSRPVATVTIPDSWEVETIEDGIEATSADEGVQVTVEAVQIKDVETATREGIKYFAESGVKIDPSTQTQKEMTMSGKPAVDISWKGRDSDGPTNVSLTFVILSEKDSILLYLWGDDKSIVQNAAALQAISESIRAVQQ